MKTLPCLCCHSTHHVATMSQPTRLILWALGSAFESFHILLPMTSIQGYPFLSVNSMTTGVGVGEGLSRGWGGGSLCGVSLENLSSQGLLSALPHKFLLGHAGPPPLPSCLRQVKSSFLGACCFVYPLLAGALFTHVALSLTPLLGPSPPPTHGFLTSSLRH